MFCSLVSCAMCTLISSDISEFVIYVPFPQSSGWTWNEMPFFILLSLLCGILTSLHTRGLLAFTRIRQAIKIRFRSRQPFAIIAETAVYAAVCALASSLVSLLGRCPEKPEAAAAGTGLELVQFNCGEGQYNPISSLLLTTSHSALKILYSFGNSGEVTWGSSLLAFITYGSLNVGLGGLPVPGGAFTATMLMGALFGRSMGALLSEYGFGASSGVYAVVGSAAMLCGFKQMTLASVLIVVECVNDLSLAPVVMLAVTISMGVNWTMNKHGYDEQVILEKKLPFLEGEPPHELDGAVALQLCDPLPASAILPPEASLDEVQKAISENPQIQYFPIREGSTGPCVGIVTRPHLKAMLATASDREERHGRRASKERGFAAVNSGTNHIGTKEQVVRQVLQWETLRQESQIIKSQIQMPPLGQGIAL
jgi:chloride channel 7